MAIHKPTSKRSLVLLRIALSLVLIGAAAYVLVRDWAIVYRGLLLIPHASIPWLVIALLLTLVTYCVSAGSYGVLALHRLRYRQTLLVEGASALVDRLLPSGIGNVGVNALYLHHRDHTPAEATVVIFTNNVLGALVHFFLMSIVLVLRPDTIHRFAGSFHVPINWWVVGLIGLLVLSLLALPNARHHTTKFVENVLESVRRYSIRTLARAAVLAAVGTAVSTCVLFSVATSLHIHLDLLQVFVVFSLGVGASTASPTPGGLVGAEAGLFASFLVYGVPSATAGAAVLLYRVIIYWLPLLPGLAALLAARRRGLV